MLFDNDNEKIFNEEDFIKMSELWKKHLNMDLTYSDYMTIFAKLKEKETDDYESLSNILQLAFKQASSGKGKERHAEENEPFEKQIICEVSRRLSGHISAGPLFQAVKKIYESGRVSKEAAVHELLGAINYIAAAIILLQE